jgi:hypothetical protein
MQCSKLYQRSIGDNSCTKLTVLIVAKHNHCKLCSRAITVGRIRYVNLLIFIGRFINKIVMDYYQNNTFIQQQQKRLHATALNRRFATKIDRTTLTKSSDVWSGSCSLADWLRVPLACCDDDEDDVARELVARLLLFFDAC